MTKPTPITHKPLPVQTPDWVKRAVFYQIFPDRFAPSERVQHPRGIQFKAWGSPPAEQGFQGGDLYGIAEKLDYLQELGITALYLNPIFASAANHRYHTFDYLVVDPLLGGNDALRVLLDEAHQRGMRVVLDGVFNHASRGFWAFHHILENGGDSPYIDWFTIHDWPLNPYPRDGSEAINYAGWWNNPALPKFNIANPGVRDYLLHVTRFWLEFGIDGWRLDVPEEIDDVPFWQEFRRVVKSTNPEAYIVGEIWHDAVDWLIGDRLDAVMNYGLGRAALGFFGHDTLRKEYRPGGFELHGLTAQQFAREVDRLMHLHDWQVTQAQLNLLDSHDTARALWIVGDDEAAMRMAMIFLMTVPGAPCIYYGTEIGMNGGHEPDSRAAFPWHDRSAWKNEWLAFTQRLIALRHAHPALSVGAFQTLYGDHGLYTFRRDFDDQSVVVILNTGEQDALIDLDLKQPDALDLTAQLTFTDVWRAASHRAENGLLRKVHIPARDAAILVRN